MTRRPPAKPAAPAIQAKGNTITLVLEGLDDLAPPARRRI